MNLFGYFEVIVTLHIHVTRGYVIDLGVDIYVCICIPQSLANWDLKL